MDGEGGFVGKMEDVWRVAFDQAEAFAIGGPIHHAGVGAGVADLGAGAGEGIGARALEFVFPAYDEGFVEKRA